MKQKTLGPWLSIKQLAERYGYSDSTVRRWLEQLERDTRISDDQRASMIYGPKRARRIHEVRFAAWLSAPPPGRNEKTQSVVFVFASPVMQ